VGERPRPLLWNAACLARCSQATLESARRATMTTKNYPMISNVERQLFFDPRSQPFAEPIRARLLWLASDLLRPTIRCLAKKSDKGPYENLAPHQRGRADRNAARRSCRASWSPRKVFRQATIFNIAVTAAAVSGRDHHAFESRGVKNVARQLHGIGASDKDSGVFGFPKWA
jgi:hypothetical protein